MALSRPFKKIGSRVSSFHASLLQAISGVMSLDLYPTDKSMTERLYYEVNKQDRIQIIHLRIRQELK